MAKPKPSAKPKRAPRANAAEKERRTSTIMTMLLSGARRPEICQFTRENWGLADRHVDRYIAAATDLIKQEAAKAREELFTEQAALRRMLRKRAIGEGDMRLALDVAKDEAKLHDLYPVQRQKIETWKDEVIAAVRAGRITAAELTTELGDDAKELLIAAGLAGDEGVEAAEAGGTPASAESAGEPEH